jgi:hypothetical protein
MGITGKLFINGAWVQGEGELARTCGQLRLFADTIKRFVRPVCYQGFPETLLPDALRNANPLGLVRLVNGERNGSAI